MKIRRAFSVLEIALLAAGCAPLVHSHEVGFAAITMVGSANDSYTTNVPTKRPVTLLDPIETRGVMAFDVIKTTTFPHQAYLVIVGTSKDDAQNAKGYFIQKAHPTKPNRSMDWWFHLSGNCWVYVYGQGPMVETDIVEAGSDGSDLLVQVDKDANDEIVHRVYFREGVKAWVRNRNSPHDYRELVPDQYVEAREDGSVTDPPLPIPAAGPIKDFLDYVDGQKQPFK